MLYVKKLATAFVLELSMITSSFAGATLIISDAWSRATKGPNGAVYMTVENKSSLPANITSTSFEGAKSVELHTHVEKDGKMVMTEVTSVTIPGTSKVVFKPGDLHIMLMGLKKPIEKGETVSLALHVEQPSVSDGKPSDIMSMTLPVKATAQAAGDKQFDASHECHCKGHH